MQDLEGKLIESRSGNKYLLTEKVGEGAQGVVYGEASEKYIIKLYHKRNRIQNEKLLDKLEWLMFQSYPDQFIKPLDIVDTPYIGYVMEKVKNHVSLNKLLIPENQNFSDWYNAKTGGLRRRYYLGYKIAYQFAMLHDTGRAYCDISGNNILVNQNPRVASVCMIDIDNIYVPGGESANVLGTSRYMAPEIINHQMEPDIFTDSYSLAVILFELLRGGHPYIGDVVDNGTPDQQTAAYLGHYPYVDDPETDMNRSTHMLPADAVFTTKLKSLFYRTFVKGKENRMERVTARDFSLAFLEASNLVMKCPECGNWHLALADKNRKYICPWCDSENQRPLFLQFKDRYDVSRDDEGEKEPVVFKDKAVGSYVLRNERNDITDNYVSNLYIKRDKFTRPLDEYFSVRMAKNGKFYLINEHDYELYYQKKGMKRPESLSKADGPVELEKNDWIIFSNPRSMRKKDVAKTYGGIVFRYAVVR